MDYIPGFFPDATCVSSHHGMNVAIWNLHERELFIDEKQGYMIRRKKTGDEFPLLFFHFSGFDPFETTVINRRHPQFNVTTYPSFKPIIEEYRERVYANGYDRFSKMTYGFNHYFDGSVITPLQRRIFRVYLNDHKVEFNPFEINTPFYKILKNSRLLLKASTKQNGFASYTKEEKNKGKKLENKVVKPMLSLALRVLGAERYAMLIRLFTLAGDKEYHYFYLRVQIDMKIAIVNVNEAITAHGGVRIQGVMWAEGLRKLGHVCDLVDFWQNYDWKSYDAVIVLGYGGFVRNFCRGIRPICKKLVLAPIIDPTCSTKVFKFLLNIGEHINVQV